jgi:biopolymer transport protein ExbB
VGYNALTRSNRVLTARLDAFAYELYTFLSTGQSLRADTTPARTVRNLNVAAQG